MYSEKLKKLVEDRVNLKFRIKNEQQSKELQEFLGALGVRWFFLCGFIEGVEDEFIVVETSEQFLHLNNFIYHANHKKPYSLTSSNGGEEYFKKDPAQEFDLENDCLVKQCKWPNLKKLVKNKVNLKFRIKDEQQSKELQEFLFANNVWWINGDHKVVSTDKPYIFCKTRKGWEGTGYSLTYLGYHMDHIFDNSEDKEFDLENDCLVENVTMKIDWSLVSQDHLSLDPKIIIFKGKKYQLIEEK